MKQTLMFWPVTLGRSSHLLRRHHTLRETAAFEKKNALKFEPNSGSSTIAQRRYARTSSCSSISRFSFVVSVC